MAGQLRTYVRGREFLLVKRPVLQVVGRIIMRTVQMLAVPDQGRAQAERRMQALMGVHDHGVRQF